MFNKLFNFLSISSLSDESIFSKYKSISTKRNDFIINQVVESLKLNNANLALDNKMLHETVEKYKKLYYDLLNNDTSKKMRY